MDKRYLAFKIALAEKELTFEELGNIIGIKRQSVNAFANTLKNGGSPNASNANRYAKALGIPVEKLL